MPDSLKIIENPLNSESSGRVLELWGRERLINHWKIIGIPWKPLENHWKLLIIHWISVKTSCAAYWFMCRSVHENVFNPICFGTILFLVPSHSPPAQKYVVIVKQLLNAPTLSSRCRRISSMHARKWVSLSSFHRNQWADARKYISQKIWRKQSDHTIKNIPIGYCEWQALSCLTLGQRFRSTWPYGVVVRSGTSDCFIPACSWI